MNSASAPLGVVVDNSMVMKFRKFGGGFHSNCWMRGMQLAIIVDNLQSPNMSCNNQNEKIDQIIKVNYEDCEETIYTLDTHKFKVVPDQNGENIDLNRR